MKNPTKRDKPVKEVLRELIDSVLNIELKDIDFKELNKKHIEAGVDRLMNCTECQPPQQEPDFYYCPCGARQSRGLGWKRCWYCHRPLEDSSEKAEPHCSQKRCKECGLINDLHTCECPQPPKEWSKCEECDLPLMLCDMAYFAAKYEYKGDVGNRQKLSNEYRKEIKEYLAQLLDEGYQKGLSEGEDLMRDNYNKHIVPSLVDQAALAAKREMIAEVEELGLFVEPEVFKPGVHIKLSLWESLKKRLLK